MRIAVLGAGNAGYTFVAHLGMKGHEVRIYEPPQLEDNLSPILEKGGVEAAGALQGFGKVALASTNIKEVLAGAELILVAVPAFAHELIMKECVPHLEEGQTIVFMPGNYASLRFHTLLQEMGMINAVRIAETSSMLYACRRLDSNKVNVMAIKHQLPTAALPAKDTAEVVSFINRVFGQFVPANNVLETSMNNLNHMVHPAPAILNAGRIENTKGNFDFYWEGITESVARVIEAIDRERLAVGTKLGVNLTSVDNILDEFYGLEKSSLYHMLSHSPVHGGWGYPTAPKTLQYRYIAEDVPYGLVPLSSIAKLVEFPTPNIDSLITLASTLNNVNYWETGLNSKKLGLSRFSPRELLEVIYS